MILDGMTKVEPHEQEITPMLTEWARRADNGDVLPLAYDGYQGHDRGTGVVGASKLGSCTRQLAYKIQGVKGTSFEDSSVHSAGIGTLIHVAIQAVARERGYGIEVPWELPEHLLASDCDIVRPEHGGEAVDIKSKGSFPYKKKLTEGPDRGEILQVAAAARALDLDHCRIAVIATTVMAGRDIQWADKTHPDNYRQEWIWPREASDELLDGELSRMALVRELLDEGRDVPRFIPGTIPSGGRIIALPDPEFVKQGKGAWQLWKGDPPQLTADGSAWQCGYCDHLATCKSDLETDTHYLYEPLPTAEMEREPDANTDSTD